MPRCEPSHLCDVDAGSTAPVPPGTAIVLVLDSNVSHLRFFYGRQVDKAYASQVGLLVRLLTSLRAANSSLPVWILTSGHRVPSVEQRLASSFGVRILPPEAAPAVQARSLELHNSLALHV